MLYHRLVLGASLWFGTPKIRMHHQTMGQDGIDVILVALSYEWTVGRIHLGQSHVRETMSRE